MVLGRPIPGTLVFTSSLLTFTVDDSTEEYSKEAYLVSCISLIQWPLEFYECIYIYTGDVMSNCNVNCKYVINYHYDYQLQNSVIATIAIILT